MTIVDARTLDSANAEWLDGFEVRRLQLLHRDWPWDPKEVDFGANAITALALGREREAANAILSRFADWFVLPPPAGMTHTGECDFAALKLCRAAHQFPGTSALNATAREKLRGFFLGNDFASIYQSENHALIFHVSRFLMAQLWPDGLFSAWGKTGGGLLEEDAEWLKLFLRYRAARGWAEFDSLCYLAPVWECLTCLFDFSEDAELVSLAEKMMNLLLAEMASESLDGRYGGAHGRIYPRHALNQDTSPARHLYYLYFGGALPAQEHDNNFAASTF